VDLKDLERLAQHYGVPPAALLYAPPGGKEFERMQRAAKVVHDAPADAADDWLRMGERLIPEPPRK
jgi:hypothetical protein